MRVVMWSSLIGATALCFLPVATSAQTSNEGSATQAKAKLAALLGYTLNGDNDFENVSPEVFLGFDTTVVTFGKGYNLRLRAGPTIGGGPNTTDTASHFRSLMLPGNLDLSALVYVPAVVKEALTVTAVAGAGLKWIGGSTEDSLGSILQAGPRVGLAVQFGGLVALTAQHTWAYHDVSTAGAEAFRDTFGTTETRLRYFTATAQFLLPLFQVYMMATYRQLLDPGRFSDITEDIRVFGLALGLDMNIFSGFRAVAPQ